MTIAGSDTRASVRRYYEETWVDYRLLWLSPADPAIHLGYYDRSTRGHADSLAAMNRALAARIGVAPGQRILDAGCGVGGSSVWLARTFDVEVVGITIVPAQIDRARRLAERSGVEGRVRFELQDYTHTTFPEASYDVVWAMESVCHTPDKPAFLGEALRVLRPGGRLGMDEHMRRGRGYAPDDEALLQSWLEGWAIPDLGTGEEWRAWCVAAGFQGVALEDINNHVRPSLQRLYRTALLCWPGAAALRALRLRTAAQHGNLRAARDQWRAFQRGLWFEGFLTATAPQ